MDVQMDALLELGAALDEDSYERLVEAHPIIARAVMEAVRAGNPPGSIQAFVGERTRSPEMARWCGRAATFLYLTRDEED
jgi:hypothetical protein